MENQTDFYLAVFCLVQNTMAPLKQRLFPCSATGIERNADTTQCCRQEKRKDASVSPPSLFPFQLNFPLSSSFNTDGTKRNSRMAFY